MGPFVLFTPACFSLTAGLQAFGCFLILNFALGGEFPAIDSGCCCIAVCPRFLSFPLTFFTPLGRWRWQNYCLLLNFCQTTKHSTKIAKQDVEFLVCGQVTARSQLRRLLEARQGFHPRRKDNWPVLFVAGDESWQTGSFLFLQLVFVDLGRFGFYPACCTARRQQTLAG